MKKYICIKDFQEYEKFGGFAVGCISTIDEWKESALEWCDADDNIETAKYIKKLPKSELIDFINEFWSIKIVPLDEISKYIDFEKLFTALNRVDFLNSFSFKNYNLEEKEDTFKWLAKYLDEIIIKEV